ncbi:MAG: hypothetical protein OIN66_05545, partial [Candidatus Methanoperedens sp.]|nr:hypothetical protein [Candidatus Methanoperedens sp.]
MSNEIILQNLRDFTVQIRHSTTDAIVGAGMVVSIDGKIVTCRHVVEAAGMNLQDAKGNEVGVYFPQAISSEKKKRRAIVAAHFPNQDDDVVMLQLVG